MIGPAAAAAAYANGRGGVARRRRANDVNGIDDGPRIMQMSHGAGGIYGRRLGRPGGGRCVAKFSQILQRAVLNSVKLGKTR